MVHKPIDQASLRPGAERGHEDARVTPAAGNQPPPYAGLNLFEADPVLAAALDHVIDPDVEESLSAAGAYWGSAEAEEVARLANVHRPTLMAWDAAGRPVDQVEHHPAYHALLARSVSAGLASSAWEEDESGVRRQHQLRAAFLYLTAQTECAHLEPVSLSHAGIAALAAAPEIEAQLFPYLASRRYDRRWLPVADKEGALLGLALAEVEGGTQLSGVATRAERIDADRFRLTGLKWHVSAPMADAVLALARTEAGVSAFLVPRILSDGSTNQVRLRRLKPTMGLEAVAAAEVVLEGAEGALVGEEGRGIAAVRDTMTLLRLDGALKGAAVMRAGLARAVHHVRHRATFGRPLIDRRAVSLVIADMALDQVAGTLMALRTAAAYDRAFDSDAEFALARFLTPVAKMWIGRRAPRLLAEAIDLVGGSAFVEWDPLPRLYRAAPGLALWGGSTGELALETLRLVEREPDVFNAALDVLVEDLPPKRRDAVETLRQISRQKPLDEGTARQLAERFASVAAAAVMRRDLPRIVADAFVASRSEGEPSDVYGARPLGVDPAALIEFILPAA